MVMTTEYAMYKGDTFIDLGTADYLAKKYHKKREEMYYLASSKAHERAKGRKRTLLYKIDGTRRGDKS